MGLKHLPAAAMVASSLLLAASAAALEDHHHIVVGQTFLAGSTDPTKGSAGWALTSHGVGGGIFRAQGE